MAESVPTAGRRWIFEGREVTLPVVVHDAASAAATRLRGAGAMLSGRAIAGALLGLAVLAAAPVRAGGDWNDKEVRWQRYQEGLAAAKKEKKPVCLIFYTEWCPHCANYSTVFHDSKVVDMTKRFVMIRLDKDKEAELSKKYAPDGEYIPRTYFLSSAGVLDADIHAPRDKFKYFYDERTPASVLAGMEEASKKLR